MNYENYEWFLFCLLKLYCRVERFLKKKIGLIPCFAELFQAPNSQISLFNLAQGLRKY